MNVEALQRGFIELDQLSRAEYREPLAEIVRDPIRLGRLVGVLLKQPFAEAKNLAHPSLRTGAYRAWHLVDSGKFENCSRDTWQLQALQRMHQELSLQERHYVDYSLYGFAVDAQHERGFFALFARTLRKYICGDKKIRKKIEDALKAGGKAGGPKIPPITPEAIVAAGGLVLGVYLVQKIPILGMVGAPVVAAVVVILYSLGVDAFCEWSERLRTEEDEKN